MKSGNVTAVVRSYAKVNLTLDVLGARPDGYHAIESVMQTIGLHDDLSLGLKDEPVVSITCDMPGIPTDERNLAHKAASVLMETTGVRSGVDIRIEKRIPVQAGLGGGSSNAATVLMGLNRLLALDLGPEALSVMAARVGSDVPFFVAGGTALVRGRGEDVHPLPDIPTRWMLVLKPEFGVSTPWAYGRLDEIRREFGERITTSARMVKCIQASEWKAIPELLSNDLELPAIEQHPEIGELKESVLRAGASGALMCGSGSAVFGLFPDEDAARDAERRLASPDVKTFVTATIARHKAGDFHVVP